MNNFTHEEHQYINLVNTVFETGDDELSRNGRTKSVFGYFMRYNLRNNIMPILTHKKVAWRACLIELLWFIKGLTNVAWLKDRGVHIWDANGTREYLDSVGLVNNPVDELGPIYGFQWRNFNGEYDVNHTTNASTKGIDQLRYIIDCLKTPEGRKSRRLIMTAWNPVQIPLMALPPCHVLCQFHVSNGNELSCSLYQRSGDIGLGVPFNIASYSFLTHLIAHHCGLVAKEFIYTLGNAHIYEEHWDKMSSINQRYLYAFPKLIIKTTRDNIDDYDIDDFEVIDYEYDKTELKLPLIA